MDALDKWFTEQTSTPMGGILFMVLVFTMRLAFDRWDRRRSTRKKKPKKDTAHG